MISHKSYGMGASFHGGLSCWMNFQRISLMLLGLLASADLGVLGLSLVGGGGCPSGWDGSPWGLCRGVAIGSFRAGGGGGLVC